MPSEEELMGLAAHMGMLRVFISVKTSPDVIGLSQQHHCRPRRLTALPPKQKLSLLFTVFKHPRCSNLIAHQHFYLPYCVQVTICSG